MSLSDFRNYRTAELACAPGVNLILGRNGQGKTNLVEAIAYFSRLGSHRVSSDSALIRAGSDAAIIRMRVAARERSVLLEAQINRGLANRAQVNRNAVKPRELPRWFSCVMFAPEDLNMVRGEPALRRKFLDEALVARHPSFSGVLIDYERVLRQRNSLLKSAKVSGTRAALEATLPVWDEQLVDLGSRIMQARQSLLLELNPVLIKSYNTLVGADHSPHLSLVESAVFGVQNDDVSRETVDEAMQVRRGDVSRETLSAEFRRTLVSVHRQELERGVTLIGPHRDDLQLSLNGLPVRGYASHGESWSFALSLRLAVAQLVREESLVGDPVIILDDVFAELDGVRRRRLMAAVGTYEQVFVTAAVEEDVPDGFDAHTVHVTAGELRGAVESTSFVKEDNADNW